MKHFVGYFLVVSCLWGCGDSETVDKFTQATSSESTSSDGALPPARAPLFKKDYDYRYFLVDLADRVLVPSIASFEQQAQQFNAALASVCASAESATLEADMTSAQPKWADLMARWQQVELQWVGPLVANQNALRNRIYSFETPARAEACAIDIAVVAAEEPSFDIATRANTARGLGALEYLLFNENLDTACSSAVQQTQNWNALPELEKRQMRCHYAQLAASDIAAQAAELSEAWAIEGGNYRSRFINPNNASHHLKQLSDALFYIEKETKDAKLGRPLGFYDCVQRACPKAVESRYAAMNAQHIADNLRAFKTVFNGANAQGFDDVIAHEGYAEIAQEINTNVDAALMLAAQLDGQNLQTQSEAILDDASEGLRMACQAASANPSVDGGDFCDLHGLLKKITDQMRTDFVTIVNVDLPKRAQSDND
ncbi:MAG TPA: imelysin family protein [Marinagarivorans sp.]